MIGPSKIRSSDGVLVHSDWIAIGWPNEPEFDLITALRNDPLVRRCFIDDRPIDSERNRAWLAAGRTRPREALLSVRRAADGLFLGMIGWSELDREKQVAEFGRLAISRHSVCRLIGDGAQLIEGVGLLASRAMRDYAFEVMQLRGIYTTHLACNAFSARVIARCGMVEQRRYVMQRPDGNAIELVESSMDRIRWNEVTEKERSCIR